MDTNEKSFLLKIRRFRKQLLCCHSAKDITRVIPTPRTSFLPNRNLIWYGKWWHALKEPNKRNRITEACLLFEGSKVMHMSQAAEKRSHVPELHLRGNDSCVTVAACNSTLVPHVLYLLWELPFDYRYTDGKQKVFEKESMWVMISMRGIYSDECKTKSHGESVPGKLFGNKIVRQSTTYLFRKNLQSPYDFYRHVYMYISRYPLTYLGIILTNVLKYECVKCIVAWMSWRYISVWILTYSWHMDIFIYT